MLCPGLRNPWLLNSRLYGPRLFRPRLFHSRLRRPRLRNPWLLNSRLYGPRLLRSRLLHSWLLHTRMLYTTPEGLAGRDNRRPRSGHVLLRRRMADLDVPPMADVVLPHQPITLPRPDPRVLDPAPSSFDVHDLGEAAIPGDVDEDDVTVPVAGSPEPEPDEDAAAKPEEARGHWPSDRAVVVRLVSRIGPRPVNDERVVDRHVDHLRAGRLNIDVGGLHRHDLLW
jgi:hypothetical protein